jgi:hypothetical protein
MTDRQAEKRSNAGRDARWDEFVADGLYSRIWNHLCEKGLTYQTGNEDRAKVRQAQGEIQRQEEALAEREQRRWARERKRRERRLKKATRR